MRSLPLALLALAGCAFDRGGLEAIDGGGEQGMDVRPPDGAPVCGCALGCAADGTTCLDFDPSNLDDLALLDGASAAVALASGTFVLDTDAATLSDPDGAVRAGMVFTPLDPTSAPGVLVWAVDGLDVAAGATLRVTGHRALIVLAADTIAIAGTLDVSAGCVADPTAIDRDRLWCGGPGGGDGGHRDGGNGRTGATGCAPGGDGDAGSTTPEHGGGGGGFGTAGGDGAGVDGIGPDSEGGGTCGAPELEPLRGGSGGGVAGYRASGSDDNRTAGGGGGGAVQLTARIAVRVTGTIDASGEGGAGTAQTAGYSPPGTDGGGGGGAGGGVLLEAPTVAVAAAAIVAANGGGGGAGITIDRRGERGHLARDRALGGKNDDATGGGFGAIGDAAGEGATGGDGGLSDGGSGGGGGAGRIRIHTAALDVDAAAVVSPAATTALLLPL